MNAQINTPKFSIHLEESDSLKDISPLLRLRVVIGYLGEKSQNGWWQSDFFSATANSFLAPVFPRTRFLTQVEGAGAAACVQHDERIGVGRVFHLFRLPEGFEQAFHQRLQEQEVIDELSALVETSESAVSFLESEFGKSQKKDLGPVNVGDIQDVADEKVVSVISQHYLAGFRSESPVFPFLRDDK